MGVGLGLEAPIALAAKIGGPLSRVENAFGFVIAACFDEEHLTVGVFSKASGDD